jgi:hypothetical protein
MITNEYRPADTHCRTPLPVRRLVFFLPLLCLFLTLPAQEKLVLHITHPSGRTTRVVYQDGDEFKFRVKNSPSPYTCTLVRICDSILYLDNNFSVELRDLDKIYVDHANFLTRKLSKFFIYLGLGYPALDALNNGFNQFHPIIDQTTLIAGGVCVVSGLVMKVAFRRKYKVGPKCTLWIIG